MGIVVQSGSKAPSIETPVRSMSIGCVFFGMSRIASITCFRQGAFRGE